MFDDDGRRKKRRADIDPGRVGGEVNSVEEVQETVEMTVDSSAADPAERLRENESEVKLAAANGSAIGVESDAKLEFIREGKKSCMRFLDADVKRPLASVSGIKDRGDKVAFGQQESYIENESTCQRVSTGQKKNVFVVQLNAVTGSRAKGTTFFRRSA